MVPSDVAAVPLWLRAGVAAAAAAVPFAVGNDEDGTFPPELLAIVAGCDPSILASAASDRLYESDRDGADRWYKIAHALDDSGETFSEHAAALAFMGDCDAADDWLEAARARMPSASKRSVARESATMWLGGAATSVRLCRIRTREVAPLATAGARE